MPIDIVYDQDVSAFTVSAEILPLPGTVSLPTIPPVPPSETPDPFPTPEAEALGADTWRVHITSTMTTLLAGRKVILKVTAQDPDNLEEPDVEEAYILVHRV
jgi:hypothetical protein